MFCIDKARVASAASRCKLCVRRRPRSLYFFPKQYFTIEKVAGVQIAFRAIQPEDEPLLVEFHKTVSDQSVHFRYFGGISLRERTLHERLRRHCAIDHSREVCTSSRLEECQRRA